MREPSVYMVMKSHVNSYCRPKVSVPQVLSLRPTKAWRWKNDEVPVYNPSDALSVKNAFNPPPRSSASRKPRRLPMMMPSLIMNLLRPVISVP